MQRFAWHGSVGIRSYERVHTYHELADTRVLIWPLMLLLVLSLGFLASAPGATLRHVNRLRLGSNYLILARERTTHGKTIGYHEKGYVECYN